MPDAAPLKKPCPRPPAPCHRTGATLALAACLSLAPATVPAQPAAPGPKLAMIGPSQPPASNPPVTHAPAGSRITAGEAMCIGTPSDPALPINRCFAVDMAGYADLPWLGRFAVEGKQPTHLEAELFQKLTDRLKGQPLRVRPALRLGFIGTWARPGEHYVPADASLWDALLVAGGPGASAAPVQILRGGELLMQVSLAGAYPRQALLKGVGIRSGDLFLLTPVQVPPAKSSWDILKEGLAVSAQLCAVMGSLLSAWLTWDYLKKNGAIK